MCFNEDGIDPKSVRGAIVVHSTDREDLFAAHVKIDTNLDALSKILVLATISKSALSVASELARSSGMTPEHFLTICAGGEILASAPGQNPEPDHTVN